MEPIGIGHREHGYWILPFHQALRSTWKIFCALYPPYAAVRGLFEEVQDLLHLAVRNAVDFGDYDKDRHMQHIGQTEMLACHERNGIPVSRDNETGIMGGVTRHARDGGSEILCVAAKVKEGDDLGAILAYIFPRVNVVNAIVDQLTIRIDADNFVGDGGSSACFDFVAVPQQCKAGSAAAIVESALRQAAKQGRLAFALAAEDSYSDIKYAVGRHLGWPSSHERFHHLASAFHRNFMLDKRICIQNFSHALQCAHRCS